MLQVEQHSFERTGFRERKDDGSVETGWVCTDCGYKRLQWDSYNVTVKDDFVESVDMELGIGVPPPSCPPSGDWLALSRRLGSMLAVKKRRDSMEKATREADQWLMDKISDIREAIDEDDRVSAVCVTLGLDDSEDDLDLPVGVLQEGPTSYTGEEGTYEVPPGASWNLN